MNSIEKKYVKIVAKGHKNSWYNNFLGEEFELFKTINKGSHENYIVKSEDKGTKKGYTFKLKNHSLGRGLDLVHEFAGEIIIKPTLDKNCNHLKSK